MVTSVTLNGRTNEVREYTEVRKCHKCNASSHTTLACPLKDRICFKCQQNGHISKDCKTRQHKNHLSYCRDCKQNHVTGSPLCKVLASKKQLIQKTQENKEKKKVMRRLETIEKQYQKSKIEEKSNQTQVQPAMKTDENQDEISRLLEENRKLKQENAELNKRFEEMSEFVIKLKNKMRSQDKNITENRETIKAMRHDQARAEMEEMIKKGNRTLKKILRTALKIKNMNPSQMDYFMENVDKEVSDEEIEIESDVESDSNAAD